MSRNIDDYFARRAEDEERLAAEASHPAVKAAHEGFAAAYRAHAGKKAVSGEPTNSRHVSVDEMLG